MRHIRRKLSVTACCPQCPLLLGRLEMISPEMQRKMGAWATAVDIHHNTQEDRDAFREILRVSRWRVRKGFWKDN